MVAVFFETEKNYTKKPFAICFLNFGACGGGGTQTLDLGMVRWVSYHWATATGQEP